MKRISILAVMFLTAYTSVNAQFTLSGEYRPRAEYRHGYKDIPATDQDAAFFIDQRTRINLNYISEKYDVKFVLQDVRVWGSQSQLVPDDGATTTIHEAWGNVKFTDWLSLKMGRQEIIYDDHRIFGSVGWAQQARSHDAAIFKVNSNGFKVDFGLAFNQDAAVSTGVVNGTDYSVGKSYKSFQYLWAHKDFDAFNASFLFLNLGKQGFVNDPVTGLPIGKTFNQKTLGGRFGYKLDALKANATVYTQFGDMTNNISTISGLLYSIDASYTLAEKHTVFAGFEHMSGNDQISPAANKNEAFTPYFGTNHKFNGLMDYFYVGNHLDINGANDDVGLNDIQFGYKGKLTDKFNAGLAVHLFSSDGDIADPTGNAMSKSLGTEIDITAGYKLSKEVGFAFGYSQMLGTDTMVALKGGDKKETANWAWLMVTIKPTFFTTKEKDVE